MVDVNKNKISSRLKNVSAEHPYVAGAVDIYDDRLERDQEDINKDTYRKGEVYNKAETYNKEEINNMITTPDQEYATVSATDQTSDIALLIATEAPDQKEQADTIYRIANWDGTVDQYDQYVYSEYAWNGTSYVFLSVKDLGHQLLAVEMRAALYGEEIADDVYMDGNGDIIVEQELNI